jgi:chromate reductase
VHIVGIVGNLRKASYNRLLLKACAELAPAGMALEEVLLDGIPMFNEDDRPKGDPEAVAIPGVLKNAIDWLSGFPCVLKAKPTGIMGASLGLFGTVRGQMQLRISLEHCAATVMPQPQVYVGLAREKFDAEGRLSDEKTRAFIAGYLVSYASWVRHNHQPPA